MDDDLRARLRELRQDPEDPTRQRAWQAAVLRLPREQTPRILEELELWEASPEAAQRAAAEYVETRSKGALRLDGLARYACGGVAFRIAGFTHRASGLRLLLIPGGRCALGEDGLYEDEARGRVVQLEAFLIGEAPVTQRDWRRYAPLPSGLRATGEGIPAMGMSFVEVSRVLEAKGLRLPSEAEWEWAARGGTTSRYPWGEDFDDARCWARHNSDRLPQDIAEHADARNAFGLIDALGNVEEWTSDGELGPHRSSDDDELPGSHARAPDGAGLRVLRGGSALTPILGCRSASRSFSGELPEVEFQGRGESLAAAVGLRVALSLP